MSGKKGPRSSQHKINQLTVLIEHSGKNHIIVAI